MYHYGFPLGCHRTNNAGDVVLASEEAKKKKKGKANKPKGGFQALNLSKDVLGGILRLGYKVPTPVQRKTLPLVLAGKDVVAMARTGACVASSSRDHDAHFSVQARERLLPSLSQ